MGVDTIQINLVEYVDAVKLKAGLPNGQIKIGVFWIVWFGLVG